MGLHKLAVESDTEEIRSDRTGEETEEHSYPKYVFFINHNKFCKGHSLFTFNL